MRRSYERLKKMSKNIVVAVLSTFFIVVVFGVVYTVSTGIQNAHAAANERHGTVTLEEARESFRSPPPSEERGVIDALNDLGWRVGEDFAMGVSGTLENTNEEDVVDFIDSIANEDPNSGFEADSSVEATPSSFSGINIAPEECSGYDRGLFPHWIDVPNSVGMDVRDYVLIEERLDDSYWISVYDASVILVSPEIDIDHLVPLMEAFCSGADTFYPNGVWNEDIATAYANDIENPETLIAVSSSSNRSKGASEPTEWMPAESAQCEYVNDWVTVKQAWGLNMDQAEHDFIVDFLEGC